MTSMPHHKGPYLRFIIPPGDNVQIWILRQCVRLGDGFFPAWTQPMGQGKERRLRSQ